MFMKACMLNGLFWLQYNIFPSPKAFGIFLTRFSIVVPDCVPRCPGLRWNCNLEVIRVLCMQQVAGSGYDISR